MRSARRTWHVRRSAARARQRRRWAFFSSLTEAPPMLSKFFLDRPVFAWVIAIVIMLVGGLAIYNLPVSQYPPIAPPSIYIQASYPGASAETVENSVTQIIEQKMTGFDKMLYLSASSDSSGTSRVELTFAPGTDPDLAWAQ